LKVDQHVVTRHRQKSEGSRDQKDHDNEFLFSVVLPISLLNVIHHARPVDDLVLAAILFPFSRPIPSMDVMPVRPVNGLEYLVRLIVVSSIVFPPCLSPSKRHAFIPIPIVVTTSRKA
jgi:hypothetical protein